VIRTSASDKVLQAVEYIKQSEWRRGVSSVRVVKQGVTVVRETQLDHVT